MDDARCLLAAPVCKATAQRHDSQSDKEKRQLIVATTLCVVFMLCELVGGYLAGSLAIMSDAAHLLSDCISFIVALLAIVLSKKSPDQHMTFGYKRIEVLGAILSILGIWLLSTFLFYFAVNRLIYQDFDIDADAMMIVSAVGIIINIIMAIVLHGDGLSCFKHGRNRQHSNCHSHGPKHEHSHYNNNKGNFEYKPLIDNSANANGCALPNGDAADRRSSTPTGSFGAAPCNQCNLTEVIALVGDFPAKPCRHTHHQLAVDPKHASAIDATTKPTIGAHNCASNTSAICPVHHYVHRDSSEHTPIGSSDSEDLAHESRAAAWRFGGHQHHHRSSGTASHLGHTHDFSSKNINIQAAVIHVVGDFIQSIGVFISAVIIKYFPQAKIADPLCTFAFSIIVMMTTCSIMKNSLGIILEAVPSSICIDSLTKDLQAINGVRAIHNLNVWSLTVGWNCLSVHIVVEPFVKSSDILYLATAIAQNGHNIKQCTIQIEEHADPDAVHLLNSSLVRTHSFRADNENPIINILA